ncbi:tetratricopeptide repeat protein [Bacteroides sedimenti]|uniref:Tetratricopeptide repeat protein n=1 Tax=Bacteroides sedimenti TaxID=2136147 RepID=A0ABN6Z0C1_9BACE
MIITFKEIMELRKGDKEKAYEVAENVYKSKGGVWVSRAYAWTLYDRISAEITSGGYTSAKPYIQEFLELNMSSTFIMNTQFLLQMERLYKDANFPALDVLRNRCFFMEEDWKKEKINGVFKPSIAEKFVSKFIKVFDRQSDVSYFIHYRPFLESAHKRMKDNIMFCNYLGKLLNKYTKQYDKALQLMTPMVNENSDFFMVWEELAEVYHNKKHYKESLACYCKALTCTSDDKHLLRIKFRLGMVLHKMGMDSEAKTEILEMVDILGTQNNFACPNWNSVKDMKWFLNAIPKSDNKALYQKQKKVAEKLVFQK